MAIDDFGGVCWPGGFRIAAQALHDHLTRRRTTTPGVGKTGWSTVAGRCETWRGGT
jgi:hypothetical protein